MKKLKRIAAVVLTGAMALTMLAGCSGSSSSGNSEKIKQINTALQSSGYSITVSENTTLTKKAEEIAALYKTIQEIPAEESSNTAYDDVREIDYEIHRQIAVMNGELNAGNIISETEFVSITHPEGPANDAQCAEEVANDIIYYLYGDEDGFDEDIGQIKKITGIGIAKIENVNDTVSPHSCSKHCGHINEESYEGLDPVHTQKVTGWIVLLSYEK